MTVEQMAEHVSQEVAGGHKVPPRPLVKVAARELTLEYEGDPHPEVDAAFAAYRRLAGVAATLGGYSVRPVSVGSETRARVTATVQLQGNTYVGQGVDDDVVASAVRAFAAAVEQTSTAA